MPSVRRIDPSGPDLESVLAVVRDADPSRLDGVGAFRTRAEAEPRTRAWLATVDGVPAGAATLQAVVYWDEPDSLAMDLAVAPHHAGIGVAGALWDAVREGAASLGLTSLRAFVGEERGDMLALLQAMGFRVIDRDRRVVLHLTHPPEAPRTPPGVHIVTGDRVTALPGVLAALDAELVRDLPGTAADDWHAWTTEEWGRLLDGPSHSASCTWIAYQDDAPVGLAVMRRFPDRPDVAHHEYTGVLAGARGRGVATALKRHALQWAWREGVRELRAVNNAANASMSAVNARLGYRPGPDLLALRGRLLDLRPVPALPGLS